MRQALACALEIATPRGAHTLRAIGMRTLAQAAVHTVERALDWDVSVRVSNFARIANKLRIAHTRALVAPSSGTTVQWVAQLLSTIETTPSRLTPASAVQAQTIV